MASYYSSQSSQSQPRSQAFSQPHHSQTSQSAYTLRQPIIVGRRISSLGPVASTPPPASQPSIEQERILLQVERLGFEFEKLKQVIEGLKDVHTLLQNFESRSEKLEELINELEANERARVHAADEMFGRLERLILASSKHVQDELGRTAQELASTQQSSLTSALHSAQSKSQAQMQVLFQSVARIEQTFVSKSSEEAESILELRSEMRELREELKSQQHRHPEQVTYCCSAKRSRRSRSISQTLAPSTPSRVDRPSPARAKIIHLTRDQLIMSESSNGYSVSSGPLSRNNEASRNCQITSNKARRTARKLIEVIDEEPEMRLQLRRKGSSTCIRKSSARRLIY